MWVQPQGPDEILPVLGVNVDNQNLSSPKIYLYNTSDPLNETYVLAETLVIFCVVCCPLGNIYDKAQQFRLMTKK